MTYVPVIVPQPPPSPRVRELAGRVGELIEQFRLEHPDLGDGEVDQALGLARRSQASQQVRLALAFAIGLLLLLGFVAFYVYR